MILGYWNRNRKHTFRNIFWFAHRLPSALGRNYCRRLQRSKLKATPIVGKQERNRYPLKMLSGSGSVKTLENNEQSMGERGVLLNAPKQLKVRNSI